MGINNYKQVFFLVLMAILVNFTIQSDCQITSVVTFDNCMSYCYNTYGPSKAFFNYTTGMCDSTMICPKDQYLVQYVNLCRNQFDPYSYQWDNFKAYFQDPALFSIIFNKVFNGYYNSKTIVCYQGWKSSNYMQKINKYAYNMYFCDLQLKDGQIYPQTHGQYFFNLLALDQQNKVMDQVFQYESPILVYSIFFLLFSCFYIVLNINQCVFRCKKGMKLKICKNRSQQLVKRLDQKNQEELKQFIQKREKNNNNTQIIVPEPYKILTNFSQEKQKLKDIFLSEKELKRKYKKEDYKKQIENKMQRNKQMQLKLSLKK